MAYIKNFVIPKWMMATWEDRLSDTIIVRLRFRGYWPYALSRHEILGDAGIYVIHSRSLIRPRTFGRILYIGETCDFWNRHQNHHRRNEFYEKCGAGFEPVVCFASVLTGRVETEAALITYYNPPCNRKIRMRYFGEKLRILSSGNRGIICPDLLLERGRRQSVVRVPRKHARLCCGPAAVISNGMEEEDADSMV